MLAALGNNCALDLIFVSLFLAVLRTWGNRLQESESKRTRHEVNALQIAVVAMTAIPFDLSLASLGNSRYASSA